MTTKECLHRFCSDCIITALRSGNKECPTCRKKLVSKRSLRPDPNFDLLISKIYPSRDEYEAIQERVHAKVIQSHSQQALVNSITEGIKSQSQNRPGRNKKDSHHRRDATNRDEGENSTQTLNGSSIQNGEENNINGEGSCSTNQSTENAPSIRSSTPSPSPSNTSSFRVKRSRSVLTSEKSGESDESEIESRADSTDVDSSEYGIEEIELIFKPHPIEMGPENALMKILKENSVRYLKTTANATGMNIQKNIKQSLINFFLHFSRSSQ